MKAKDKYLSVFGKIESLSDQLPWTNGVSNLVEHLLWDTKAVLGIHKTTLIKKIILLLEENCEPNASVDVRIKFIEDKLKQSIQETDCCQRYDDPKGSYCGPREALRRNRYFSEDYLNAEFDIFLSLSSDEYLDFLYGKFMEFTKGNQWATHGKSGLFENSTGITKMQMDNLAYNEDSRILVANELKLGGKKNKDQLLKYSFMHIELKKKFIATETGFLLFFIGNEHEYDLHTEIDKEIMHCQKKPDNFKHILDEQVKLNAKTMHVENISWMELVSINEDYATRLGPEQQVEKKLLAGFAKTLRDKKVNALTAST